MARGNAQVGLIIAALGVTMGLSGCIAKTALDVVTAPVKIVSKTVDFVTVSQSEKDEKRGREIRQREAKLAKLERNWQLANAECESGKPQFCRERDNLSREIDRLIPSIPVESVVY